MLGRINYNSVLKNSKKCKLSRLVEKFNVAFKPLGDSSCNHTFSARDLECIMLFDEQKTINTGLFEDEDMSELTNIYSLMDEGVLSNRLTGADLGIYDYIEQPVQKFDNSKYLTNCKISRIDDIDEEEDEFLDEDYSFSYCLLAENNPLGNSETQPIITFKGYLEIINPVAGGIIRNCDCSDTNSNIQKVFISGEYVNKYKLRSGDEIICACVENDGKMVLTSLMSINQVSHLYWDCGRPWFKCIKNTRTKKINDCGEFLDSIVSKYGINKGDNSFVYINKNTQKSQILNKLILEFSEIFDKVIYINPQYKGNLDNFQESNIVKFCADFNDLFYKQQTVAMMGADYARRMLEMGQDIVVVVDDMDGLEVLDKGFDGEMPICKTVLGSTKAWQHGSVTLFTLVPLRNKTIKTFSPHSIFKAAETLGIVIDNDQVDVFRSYRI